MRGGRHAARACCLTSCARVLWRVVAALWFGLIAEYGLTGDLPPSYTMVCLWSCYLEISSISSCPVAGEAEGELYE